MPYSDPDKIAKLIPFNYNIEEALINVHELQEFYRQDRFKDLINLAKKVEGTARHASTHAAGVVIADKTLTDYVPLQRDSHENRITTQYDMYALDCNSNEDAIGLLKMDFLGLRNLTTLQKAIEFVFQQRRKKLDISEIPLDDQKVFDLLSQGETIGIFQLESAGMRRVAKNLQPSKFSDITAMVALYRPGPMELINDFIQGKAEPSSVVYPHKDLEPILKETYGIAVYQEQCLLIANVMAGYSLGEADNLRRAIGKKKRSIMAKEKKKFIEQAKAKKYTEAIAQKVWGYIEKFTGYGFNKAHATSYAMIAYQTAYMKANYPVEFMAALLTAEAHNKDKIPIAIEECKRMKINVLPPDINQSDIGFSIIKDKTSLSKQAIRFGLSAIKHVGQAAIKAILKPRKNKNFTSLTDFCRRVDHQKVNKKVLESLIQVGAFDQFGKRAAMLVGLEKIRQRAAEAQKQKNSPQVALFKDKANPSIQLQDSLPEVEELSKHDLLSFEKQLLGFYLTEHPLAETLIKIKTLISHEISQLDPEVHLNQTITLGGIIRRVKQVFTKKNNNEMAFVTLEDGSGAIDLVVFPKIYEKTKPMWQAEQVVLVIGRVDFKEEKLSVLVESVSVPGQQSSPTASTAVGDMVQLILTQKTPKQTLIKLNQLFLAHPGPDSLWLILKNGPSEVKKIKLPFTIDYKQVKQEIKKIISPRQGKLEVL